MKQVNRIAWLYKNHIYWRRPSASFKDMFEKAKKVMITFLPEESEKVLLEMKVKDVKKWVGSKGTN